jgi:hypothetical protein
MGPGTVELDKSEKGDLTKIMSFLEELGIDIILSIVPNSI